MIRQNIPILFFLMLLTGITSAQENSVPIIKWKLAAILPSSDGNHKSLGFAGAINGVSSDAFIVAGGSNFPGGLPWNGGKKYYSKQIHILQKENDQYSWYKKAKFFLPEAVAYCGVTSTPMGIVYAGGENENGILDKVFIMVWDKDKCELAIKSLPSIPLPLTNVALTHLGNEVWAAGGDETDSSSNLFFSLNLDDKNPKWKSLPDLPVAVANATLIAQEEGGEKKIYLIGGRTKTKSGISELHHTTFVFTIKRNQWEKCADISDGEKISDLSAAAGVAIDKNYILIAGFDNGKVFHQIESLMVQIKEAKTPVEKAKLTAEKNNLSIYHKGFDRRVLLYNISANVWNKIGVLPFPAQVTTSAVRWGNKIVISNGEIKPGIRTPNVLIGSLK